MAKAKEGKAGGGDRDIKKPRVREKPVSGFVSPTGQRFYIKEENV